MGLDKWLKTEEGVKKEKKKKAAIPKTEITKKKGEKKPDVMRSTMKLEKYILKCPNAKCKYQKTILKKQLTDIDKICPRCNKEMKVKNK